MEDSGIDSGDHNGDLGHKGSQQNGDRLFPVRFLFSVSFAFRFREIRRTSIQR